MWDVKEKVLRMAERKVKAAREAVSKSKEDKTKWDYPLELD